jgi:predicted hotdog family 3-hydroxylacyl-ACP dehydratase
MNEMTDIHSSETLGRMVELPVSEFVLHRDSMLLLDRLLEIEIDRAVCEWRVSADDGFFLAGKGVPSYVGIEHMAQCIAIHAGALERAEGFPPPLGLLLGTRLYRASERYFEEGETYRVECKKLIGNFDGMGSFDCSISTGNRVIVQARLSVLQKPRGEYTHG